jgi:putative addiction module component (TIGR02574 family)
LRVISSITYRASKKQVLRLSLQERGALVRRLIVSLEGVPEDSPESIAKAWDEEMARRVADMEWDARSGFRQPKSCPESVLSFNAAKAAYVD